VKAEKGASSKAYILQGSKKSKVAGKSCVICMRKLVTVLLPPPPPNKVVVVKVRSSRFD